MTLRWGLAGTGNIARTFANALGSSATSTLAAVASRTADRAEGFAAEYAGPGPVLALDYDTLVDHPDIQAIYVATPHPQHADWVLRALRADKHVLCEKPMGLNYPEVMAMVDAAADADRFLMEAFMYRCHPQTRELQSLLEGGAIGTVRQIRASFGFSTSPRPESRLFAPELGGGGIMDVGCYTTSIARLIAGAALGLSTPAEPVSVQGVAHIGERGRVDEWASASVLFPNDIVADLFCGTAIGVQSDVRIWGTGGSLVVPAPWKPIQGQIVLNRAGAEPESIEVPSGMDCYALEADVIARSMGGREAPYPCMTWQDSLGNMKALDQWRAAVGLVFDAER